MHARERTLRRYWARNWPPWVGLFSVALEILLTAPFLQRATEENEVVHDTQHGLIMVGGLLMGYALHDLTRGLLWLRRGVGGRTPSPRVPLIALAGVFLMEIALVSTPVDQFSEKHRALHFAVHGGIYFGGVAAGFAIGEARRRGVAERRRQQRA